MKPVEGDPLTNQLPRTKLIVPQAVMGPTRRRRTPPEPSWPLVPDALAVTLDLMKPERVAYVRTRFGIRRWQIRVINRSTLPGRNRGRHYIVAQDRKGICHSVWADRIVRVETVRQALSRGLLSIGPSSPSDDHDH